MSNHISALTGEVVQSGESFDVNGNVLTTDSITARELAYKYNKDVTALVDGKYVGWGYAPSFIFFKASKEAECSISEITYWGDLPTNVICRYHALILIACGGYDSTQFYMDRTDDAKNERYWTHIRGELLPKSKTQYIKFKTRFDKQGNTIKES